MLKGRVHKFGDNVNTDEIIPARYLNTSDAAELGRHVMEAIVPQFAASVRSGDIIAAGRNFGCGSSREHAPLAIKAAGVAAVVAASFARIFFRNAINIGLPIAESAELAAAIESGDELELDFECGLARLKGCDYRIAPYPPELREIVAAGGLVPYARKRLAARRGA